MQAVDASSIVYAWDNYPLTHFPPLWRWIREEIRHTRLSIPLVAYEEVQHVSPDCHAWLKQSSIEVLSIGNVEVSDANRIKGLLGIQGDRYGSGVGENDLLIIACVRARGAELISNENVQPTVPKVMANYKIPAVCALPSVNVMCNTFLTYLKRSANVFEE